MLSTQPNFSTCPAGRLQHFVRNWQELTSDRIILSYVKGCKIEFEIFPNQARAPKPLPFSVSEQTIIHRELQTLLQKGVIEKCFHEDLEYISTIFTRPKKNGTHRVILNLKELNQQVDYHHFKMDTIHTCVELLTKGAYMASLDLRDAYYSVPIHKDFQKYLKFQWGSCLYQFTCLPNGLASAPRIFTKLMKPVYSHLRLKGHISSPYLDDSFLVADTYQDCVTNVQDTLSLLKSLGFVIHDEKSQIRPVQVIEHLGFIFDSMNMTVTVNIAKIQKLQSQAHFVLTKVNPTIREVAGLIGMMVSCFPGVEHGQLYYRRLEMLKAECLKKNFGNFDAKMMLDFNTRSDIRWWVKNVGQGKQISHGTPVLELKTDASLDGWGAFLAHSRTGGRWNQLEREQVINVLECKAILYGLQSFRKDVRNKHILVKSDNTTAVAYINHMGGSVSEMCNNVSRETWEWCISQDIWITAAHIPGKANVEADWESRNFNDQSHWKLNVNVFEKICAAFGKPDVDLFASRLNFQCKPFVSWRPDPEADAIDAFTVDWNQYSNVYIFPPFSLLNRVLQKFTLDKAQGIVVAPYWPTQSWFPRLKRMMRQPPMIFPPSPILLTAQHDLQQSHPLAKTLRLMVCSLSAR